MDQLLLGSVETATYHSKVAVQLGYLIFQLLLHTGIIFFLPKLPFSIESLYRSIRSKMLLLQFILFCIQNIAVKSCFLIVKSLILPISFQLGSLFSKRKFSLVQILFPFTQLTALFNDTAVCIAERFFGIIIFIP